MVPYIPQSSRTGDSPSDAIQWFTQYTNIFWILLSFAKGLTTKYTQFSIFFWHVRVWWKVKGQNIGFLTRFLPISIIKFPVDVISIWHVVKFKDFGNLLSFNDLWEKILTNGIRVIIVLHTKKIISHSYKVKRTIG